MTDQNQEPADSQISSLLQSPETCALYLTDALETATRAEITEALRNIQLASGGDPAMVSMGTPLHLAEILEILARAGIKLVATPK